MTVCYGGPRLGGRAGDVLRHGAQQRSLPGADGLVLLRPGRRGRRLRVPGWLWVHGCTGLALNAMYANSSC